MFSSCNSEHRSLPSPQHSGHEPLQVFTVFPELAAELRLAIFEQAIEDIWPRHIIIDAKYGWPEKPGDPRPGPILRPTCAASKSQSFHRGCPVPAEIPGGYV